MGAEMLKNHKLKYNFFDCIINLMGCTCQKIHRYIMMYYCYPIQISRHSIAHAPDTFLCQGRFGI